MKIKAACTSVKLQDIINHYTVILFIKLSAYIKFRISYFPFVENKIYNLKTQLLIVNITQ